MQQTIYQFGIQFSVYHYQSFHLKQIQIGKGVPRQQSCTAALTSNVGTEKTPDSEFSICSLITV